MTTRELMIGNWVKRKSSGNYQQVKEVLSSMVLLENEPPLQQGKHMTIPIQSVEPIPLTPSILEKCGFKKLEDFYWKDKINIGYITNDEHFQVEVCHPCLSGNKLYESYVIDIPYLHQLQNYWPAWTGTELEINL